MDFYFGRDISHLLTKLKRKLDFCVNVIMPYINENSRSALLLLYLSILLL